MNNLDHLIKTDLGSNVYELHKRTSTIHNGILVDLGVREGISSEIMLLNSLTNNNKVFGVDVDFSPLKNTVKEHQNYTSILGDSCTIGKTWYQPINCLFVDTFHIKEQVMCELYYWYKHVIEGGYIIFHDSNWPNGKYDVYNEIRWDRVEYGIKEFFNINELEYEDEFIKSENYPDSWGMTIITLKKKRDFLFDFKNWNEVFKKRNELISIFWNKENKGNVTIDLTLSPNDI